jgi:putative NIF3 family GTP cyclohydrolase 1 type 2
MRVLLDENLDRRLKTSFVGHDVATVTEAGWKGLKNGKLLTALERDGFDVLITGDKSIRHQQNLNKYRVAVILLYANDNRLSTLRPLAEEARKKLEFARKGEILEIHQ